jgi:ABC-type dipeptide/oligopeptide/nickel transport system permease component
VSGRFLLRRVVLAVPTLIGVAIIVFVLLRVVPGDPIAMMMPPGASAADIDNLRHLYGLDRPILVQFLHWAADLLHGNLGTSISLRQNVVELVLGRLPATLELVCAAMLVAVAGGSLLAVAAVYWRGRWPEALVDGISGLGQAIPDFLWALLFILGLGVLFPILPISGRVDPESEFAFVTQFYLLESLLRGRLDLFVQLLSHLVLPALALALPLMAVIARVLKNSLGEAMQQDYILLARIKGFSRLHIILREALRNALIPTVTLTGVQFTFLLGGTVLVERIFGYPGIGNMSIGAVIDRDLPLIQGLILTFAVLFIATNLLIDMSYVLLNPRLRND